MSEKKSTGIYFCECLNGDSNAVNTKSIIGYVKGMPNVAAVWSGNDILMTDAKLIAKKLNDKGIKRIVIAGDRPGFVKPIFTKAMAIAGNSTDDIILAGFREYGAITSADTERAKAIVACAVYDVAFEDAAIPEENTVNPATLVIGAGIAGIQAALEIADSKNKVYLVEKSGTIGGYMATFDKTFPTLDCAACILTPKMVEVGQHSHIELMTYSEVREVTGEPGNFKVKILKKARRVNIKTCIGCGTCAEKCPAKASSEFDSGTTLRKAIYIPFPQAVPNKYLIDAESCTYVKTGKCGTCVKVCPVKDCINLDEKDTEVEINVGNIIVATGFKPFDAKRIERYGYGRYPNVVTSLEFERLVNAAGPTGGNIKFRTQDKKGNWIFTNEAEEPKSIAIIHCIGSRDENYNKYCSRVCCMYSLKLAHLAMEKLPKADVHQYFIDMRAFGKGYEEFYKRIEHEGVHMIRGKTAKVEEVNGMLKLRGEDILNDKLIEQNVDMVILSVGLEPREDTPDLSNILGIPLSEEGWFMERNRNTEPTGTVKGGIFIAGVCQGPKDIPDSVAQGSAAAARVIRNIIKGKVKQSIKDLSFEKILSKAKELA